MTIEEKQRRARARIMFNGFLKQNGGKVEIHVASAVWKRILNETH